MNKIVLIELKTFTEQDALDYCQINNLNPDNITKLNLSYNYLTDISGIKIFKNLKYLDLYNNKLADISVLKNLKILDLNNNYLIRNISIIKYLTELKTLDISNLKLESDQIEYIQFLTNLKTLKCYKGFRDMTVLKQFNNLIIKK